MGGHQASDEFSLVLKRAVWWTFAGSCMIWGVHLKPEDFCWDVWEFWLVWHGQTGPLFGPGACFQWTNVSVHSKHMAFAASCYLNQPLNTRNHVARVPPKFIPSTLPEPLDELSLRDQRKLSYQCDRPHNVAGKRWWSLKLPKRSMRGV